MVHKYPFAGHLRYEPRMPRPTKGTQIGVRVESDLLTRIDDAIVKLRTAWHEPTRSDIVRACIIEALPRLEAQAERIAEATAGDAKPPPRARKRKP
jgi:hypothetical protein